jgi:hypothetical protein
MVAKNPRSRIVSSSALLATGRPHPGMVVEAARMKAPRQVAVIGEHVLDERRQGGARGNPRMLSVSLLAGPIQSLDTPVVRMALFAWQPNRTIMNLKLGRFYSIYLLSGSAVCLSVAIMALVTGEYLWLIVGLGGAFSCLVCFWSRKRRREPGLPNRSGVDRWRNRKGRRQA